MHHRAEGRVAQVGDEMQRGDRHSEGGTIRSPPRGTVVIGGMLAATIIAIFLIPVTFDVVERFASRGKPAPVVKKINPEPAESGAD